MAINVETNLNYDIKVLEKNVADLQEQLQKSYIRNSELIEQNNALKKERDAMMHHNLSIDEIKRKANININHSVTYDGDSFIVEILDKDINLAYLDEILLDKEEQV